MFAVDTLQDWYNLLTASDHAATGRPDLEWSRSNPEVSMKPRAAVLSLILVLFAPPVSSHGQQPAKVYRIGWLSTSGHETPPKIAQPRATLTGRHG